ncbi:MFS transporter [Fervidobacterium thailandense]|uniref:MFS transporter n=2 Tax=Fervidobacterium thailandense TaxID=1008305 RepID=A0A1E3G346_9BACT|nr:MFS transporter [Fervidobacterium thailandense]
MSENLYEHEARNLFLVLSGRFESIVGATALMTALPLYVLDLTKSGTIMGLVTMLELVPRLFILPFGGVIGDRVNRKWWMVAMDELHGILILSVWLLSLKFKINLPILISFIVASSVIDGLFSGPTAAMFGDVVKREHMKLATSLNAVSRNFANIIGPILGGFLYGKYGFSNVLLITGLLYVFSGITEMFILYRFEPKYRKLNFFAEIGEGIKFVWSHRGLKFLFLFAVVLNFLASPLFMVVFPYLARVTFKFSAPQYGSLQVFATVGAMLGNFAIIFLLRRASSKTLIVSGLIFQSLFAIAFSIVILPFFGIGAGTVFWIFALAFLVISFFNVLVNIPINANLQIMIPSQLRSRVFSVLEFLATCMMPVSSMLYGYILDKVNPLWFFLSINLLTAFVVMVFIIKAPQEAYEPGTTYQIEV